MKRLAATVSSLAFAIAFVPAVSSGSTSGPFDSVSGSGWRGTVAHPTTPTSHFAVSAAAGALGVSGTYSSTAPTALLNFRGSVTCLLVGGNHAVVGGVTTSGGAPGQIGTGFAVGFVDNPGPNADLVTFTDAAIGTPADCVAEAALFTLETFPVLRGNVVVTDAS